MTIYMEPTVIQLQQTNPTKVSQLLEEGELKTLNENNRYIVLN